MELVNESHDKKLKKQIEYSQMEIAHSESAKFVFRRNAYYGTISEVESETKRDFQFERRCY